jgi:hypothetical protein
MHSAKLKAYIKWSLEEHAMIKSIGNFCADEEGAVTVDWVVITAAVVGLAVAAHTTIKSGATDLTGKTGSFLTVQDPSSKGNIQD